MIWTSQYTVNPAARGDSVRIPATFWPATATIAADDQPETMMLALVVLLALLAADAPEDEGCILSLEAIQGQLDHHAEGVTTVVEPTRSDRRLSESIRMADGTVVSFEIGGCAHFGFSYSYPGVEMADAEFAPAAALAAQLLGRTPVREGSASYVQVLIGALDSPHETPAGPGQTFLGCGDAVCSLTVTRDEKRTTVTLTVAYDFPL
jgi:hypothetical protein